MESTKYIGMDVHKDAISIAVLNSSGKLVMESVIETKANTILEFVHGLRGSLHLTFEEGTWAAWLYDLLKPHVTKLVVCDPRRNDYLKQGSKSDRIDARKLAELLRSNLLRPVYHGEHGVRPLKELARSYLTITKDQARVMTRVKAVYRSWAIPCAGKQVYGQRHRLEWLGKIQEPGVRRRAEFYYLQLDALRSLRLVARRELLLESRKHGRVEAVKSDSVDWPHPGGPAERTAPDPGPLSHQATAVGLQRVGDRNPRQRREPVR
jgi:hypothetical protein